MTYKQLRKLERGDIIIHQDKYCSVLWRSMIMKCIVFKSKSGTVSISGYKKIKLPTIK
jgi:hypothetical protein